MRRPLGGTRVRSAVGMVVGLGRRRRSELGGGRGCRGGVLVPL